MERKWWHDKVAYQIYPKRFSDCFTRSVRRYS